MDIQFLGEELREGAVGEVQHITAAHLEEIV
jgi:hypothetical protein